VPYSAAARSRVCIGSADLAIRVDARVGLGRPTYIGWMLWLELPAGVGGAYQLVAHLISLEAE
jgi:hypothetical protein